MVQECVEFQRGNLKVNEVIIVAIEDSITISSKRSPIHSEKRLLKNVTPLIQIRNLNSGKICLTLRKSISEFHNIFF